MNFFRNQLSQVIEWDNQDPAILVYKYPSSNDELNLDEEKKIYDSQE
mgnify:CR=1 FL=1